MFNFFITLIFIVSCLLILVVLIQNTKEEGLGRSYLGDRSIGNRWIGVQNAGDVLEQVTWGLATMLFVLVMLTATVVSKRDKHTPTYVSPNIEQAQRKTISPTDSVNSNTQQESSR